MKNKIENPKVFISYAWGTDEYQAKVLSFATALVDDGIDVILDKWDLSEGNDTNAFMEKCVTDQSITNVLMLLDPIYAEKADGRRGGVGIETQIISSEVYGKVEQDKFIPIVFARNDNGEICKPTYLKSRLHFDLSNEDCYDTEYQRLVKRLFGREIYAKPQLGNKPAWIDSPQVITAKAITKYNKLKQNEPQNVKKELFFQSLEEIKQNFVNYNTDKPIDSIKDAEYISLYGETRELRNNFLELISHYIFVSDSVTMIGDFFEEIQNLAMSTHGLLSEIKRVLVHEMFIYAIAIMVKRKDYKSAGYLLGKTYFDNQCNSPRDYNFFYSASYHTNLDNCINRRDDKNYYSGTAAYWIETLSEKVCSKNDFVLADLLCYNYSILGARYVSDWKWFPILYVYGGGYNYTSAIQPVANRMQSREFLSKFIAFFGYSSIEEFVKKYKEAEDNNNVMEYRFSSCFDPAPALISMIKSDKLGIVP